MSWQHTGYSFTHLQDLDNDPNYWTLSSLRTVIDLPNKIPIIIIMLSLL